MMAPPTSWNSADDRAADYEMLAVELVPLASAIDDSRHLGGEPHWLQQDATPTCLGCGRAMAFLAQHTPDELAPRRLTDGLALGFPWVWYWFGCRRCRHLATLEQHD